MVALISVIILEMAERREYGGAGQWVDGPGLVGRLCVFLDVSLFGSDLGFLFA
jgi:hypothetical protein